MGDARASAGSAAPVVNSAHLARLSPEVLERNANDLLALIPLIREVKNGATVSAVTKRAGMGAFKAMFKPDGTMKPAASSFNAQSLHNKLQALLQSPQPQHRQLAARFEAEAALPTRPVQLERYARELEKLIPMINAVKNDGVTPAAVSQNEGMRSFSFMFKPDGTTKPAASNTNAHSLHNKLKALEASHPVSTGGRQIQSGDRQAPAKTPRPRCSPAPRRNAPGLEQLRGSAARAGAIDPADPAGHHAPGGCGAKLPGLVSVYRPFRQLAR
ncbi:hypothetical protein J2W49_001931 [Hydrogenophaga palleronii]|uniref:Uncharacterized protein n=1 Tax=Hydrogenophaga palleronii TaxID=65655 RepID=A0ABU1WKZ9_9BURK|nr:hypothetical protein [Hydrogenophaga palleronii]MDR7149976.1 hypothetical protein [Hydrogenophaga palleronii]